MYSIAITCRGRTFRFGRNSFRHLLFWHSCLWHLGYFKEISIFMIRPKWRQTDRVKHSNMRAATFGWWDFWLFRRCHRHFLFRDNFLGSFRHLKDISKITFRSYESTGTNYFQEQKSYIFLSLRSVTSTCNRWNFWLFRRCRWYFLWRDDFLGSFRHLKDISKIIFRSYAVHWNKYFPEQKHYVFLRSVTNTFSRWDFWLFRRCHWWLLFRDNFLWSLRHLKEISKFIFRSYRTTRTKYFQEQMSFIF